MGTSSGECDVCHGTGWKLWNDLEEGYPLKVDKAIRCPKCSGPRRSGDRTGVPDNLRDVDIGQFDFKAYEVDASGIQKVTTSMIKQWVEWKRFGKGLYLWSETSGSGKTFLACCLGKSVMIKYDLQMRFITAPDYIKLVAESYNRERGENDPTEVYRSCSFLIFDDIGAQVGKEWQRQEIFQLVNQRLSAGYVTIYTSNMPIEKLNVDDRTKDRIIKSSIVLQMPEDDIRGKLARKEQNDFLQRMGCSKK